MKSPNLLFYLLFCFLSSTQAQEYKKYINLSLEEIDSLVMISYQERDFQKCLILMQAGRDKAKLKFGKEDSIFATYTNDLGFFYKELGQYQSAESLFLEAIAIQKKALGEKHPHYAGSIGNLASLYQRIGDYTEAEFWFLKSIEVHKKAFGKEHPNYANSLIGLAIVYKSTWNHNKAESLFLQAMKICKKTLGDQDPTYARSLNVLGALYDDMENHTEAELLFLQAMAIQEKTVGKQHPDYALSLNNLALSYNGVKNYTKAEPLYLEAAKIQKEVLGEQHPDYAGSLNNLAIFYKNMGDYDKAKSLYLQAMAIYKGAFGEQHPYYAKSLNNLGALYVDMGNYTEGESLYLEAMEIRKKTLGEQHIDYLNSLNNLAFLYEKKEKLDTALYYCRLGIIANASAMDSDFSDWSNLDTFYYISTHQINRSIRVLLYILQKQYDKTKAQNKLENYYAVAQAAIRLNEHIRNKFIREGEKLRILKKNNEYVLAVIRAGIELGKTDYEAASFGFAEMNKGVLLLTAVRTTYAQQFGNLPDSLAQREKVLQKKQSDLTAKLVEKRLAVEKDSLRGVLNNINQEINVFTKMLKNKFSKYVAFKYNYKTANLEEIQDNLDRQTALLEYVIGDSVVYAFYVDKKQIKLTPIYLPNEVLNDKIKDFHSTLSNHKLAIKQPRVSYENYTQSAYWFYKNLVAPNLKNTKGIKSLIIVTDQKLGYLPFETFLVEAAPASETDYRQLNYLIDKYNISYSYSATLWMENSVCEPPKNNGQILAMAANYEIDLDSTRAIRRLRKDLLKRVPLKPLPAAKQEVEVLSKKIKGFFAFDMKASEKVFKDSAKNYGIIHLAMHGLLDSKAQILSSLVFTEDSDSLENNFLHAYEISKMELNANLVVLSACETGYGRFEQGNGISSLARAFMYAGASSLIVSLWQVNDDATSKIMQNLYNNLSEGMKKNEALRQAKLDYIKNATEQAAHPVFWSSFIMMGNTSSILIKRKNDSLVYSIGLVVLCLLGIGVLLLRKLCLPQKKGYQAETHKNTR